MIDRTLRSEGGGQSRHVALFGAPADTCNHGVTALQHATVAGLRARLPDLSLTVFDNGTGSRPRAGDSPDGVTARIGVRRSRRIHRPEAWFNVRACAKLGGLWNPAARTILASDAILDISGGDSFTDLYGEHRFRTILSPKQAAIETQRPLILLPQTLGPFRQPRTRYVAARILREADQVWARGNASFAVAQELLGADFDPDRHRLGVDVAFGLEAQPPTSQQVDDLESWWERQGRPSVGINVSGLIYYGQEGYDLVADYRVVIQHLVKRLVEEGGACVVLVPHVLGLGGSESDESAMRQVLDALAAPVACHVRIAPSPLSAAQTKWLIGRFDWFCGTRMHSTIAGLSSGVPTSAIAYSFKTREVFGLLGESENVVDPRKMGDADVADRLWEHWQTRGTMEERLASALRDVRHDWDRQMSAIADRIAVLAARPRRDTRSRMRR